MTLLKKEYTQFDENEHFRIEEFDSIVFAQEQIKQDFELETNKDIKFKNPYLFDKYFEYNFIKIKKKVKRKI